MECNKKTQHPWIAIRTSLAALAGIFLLAACGQSDDSSSGASKASLATQWSEEEWVEDTMAWRDWRLERLMLPDGYLSLAALDYYPAGQWTVGSDEKADIVVPGEPATWGTLVLDETMSNAWFLPAADGGVTVDYPHPEQIAGPLPDMVRLSVAGDPGKTSRVGGQSTHFYVAVRKGDWAVRARDPNSRARTEFVGLDYYPLNRDFQVVGKFEAHEEGSTIPTATVLGEVLQEPNPGRVVFELGGQTFSLEAIAAASGDQFFFIFADRTSGKETYGLGRFVYSDLPNEAGEVVLDFNRAYNPPCAFNAFTSCPLPPAQNRIDFPIEAGELTYRGEVGQDPDQLPLN